MKEAVLWLVTEPDVPGWLSCCWAGFDPAPDLPAGLAGVDLVFFRVEAAEVLGVREVVLLIFAAADPEAAVDPEVAAADPEVAADPEALLEVEGFSFSSSAKDGSFSGQDLRMFSWVHIRS